MQLEAVMIKCRTRMYVNGRKPKPEQKQNNEASIQNIEKW